MDWDRNILTVRRLVVAVRIRSIVLTPLVRTAPQDSGGFQMVSLLKLADVTEVRAPPKPRAPRPLARS